MVATVRLNPSSTGLNQLLIFNSRLRWKSVSILLPSVLAAIDRAAAMHHFLGDSVTIAGVSEIEAA